MNPIKFKTSNACYAENQPEYIPLPCEKFESGLVLTLWKASLKERLWFLLKGKMWLKIMTFNKPLQPLKMSIFTREG